MKQYDTTTEVPIEIIQIWEAAWAAQPTSENPFVIPCDDKKGMTSLRQHLYQARKRLVTEKYPGSMDFYKLEIHPVDTRIEIRLPSWFRAVKGALRDAGVPEVPQPQRPELPPEPVKLVEEEVQPLSSENLKTVQHLFRTQPGEQK